MCIRDRGYFVRLADGDFEHRERLLSTAEATGRKASMRARLVGIVAVIATVALAAFAANGFSGEGPDMRSVDTGYSTPRSDVHRVAAPSGPVSASRLAQASNCLLYTSDAADDLLCVDLGGRR